MNRKKAKRRLKSAFIYVRKSTNHKRCSTSKQMVAIREFAKRRGFEIVKQFSDEGEIQTGSHAT
jgi:DNA invertase Pin-like site-specific DNA recombinase